MSLVTTIWSRCAFTRRGIPSRYVEIWRELRVCPRSPGTNEFRSLKYAPIPTADQLSQLASELGGKSTVRFVRRFQGGLGCTSDLLEIHRAISGTELVVLRRYGDWYGDDESTDEVARREAAALIAANAGGVTVPQLIWSDRAGTFDETAVVISFIDGEPYFSPGDPHDWIEQLVRAMVSVHEVPVTADLRPVLLDHRRQLSDQLAESEPSERFTENSLGVPLWELRRKLIEADDSTETVFLHSDLWPGNTLWRDEQLVGVIDWEDAGFGDPSVDVAYCANELRYLGWDGLADRFIAEYRSKTGRSLDSLPLWTVSGLVRPLPDIARWMPSWTAMGLDVDADSIRANWNRVAEQAIAEQV